MFVLTSTHPHGYNILWHRTQRDKPLAWFGQRIDSAEIRSGGDGSTKSAAVLGLEIQIMVLLAGVICLGTFDIPSTNTGGGSQDAYDIINLLDEAVPESEADRDAIVADMRLKTIRLFEKPFVQKAATALAHALLVQRSMNGEDIHRILDPILALCPDRPWC
jgi:hypothetical protein